MSVLPYGKLLPLLNAEEFILRKKMLRIMGREEKNCSLSQLNSLVPRVIQDLRIVCEDTSPPMEEFVHSANLQILGQEKGRRKWLGIKVRKSIIIV